VDSLVKELRMIDSFDARDLLTRSRVELPVVIEGLCRRDEGQRVVVKHAR
jgi:hypothetical protein